MGKVICPRCGVFTSFSPEVFIGDGMLLEESREHMRLYKRVALNAVTAEEPRQDTYAILICQACEKRFVAQKEKYRDEWSAAYPILHKPVSEDIPEPIKSELEEAYLCFAVGAHRGCLLVCRTALIDMQREQGVSSLQELKDKGIISNLLYGQADQVRLWANMVGHEVVLPEAVTKEDTEHLLAYLGTLLDTVYVQPKQLSALSQKREELKKETKRKPPPSASDAAKTNS